MAQRLSMFGLGKAGGIIAVLFLIGMVLVISKVSTFWGYLAIAASVVIGIIYAMLGIRGILGR